MSNFPLSYKLSWLPRFLKPSLAGAAAGFAPAAGRWLPLPPARSARLVFLGDISAVANRDAPEIDPALRKLIVSADLVIGNCESPVVERPRAALATRLGLSHAMTPDFLDRVIDAAGIERTKLVLSLANNHMLDQGVAGFEETVAHLARLGIRTIGTAADGPLLRAKAGPLTVGLSAFTQWRNGPAADFAGRVTMADDVAAMDAEGVDLACAFPHWDHEFRHFPQASTRALARKLAGQGARLIVGNHAHVVQAVERAGDVPTAYGLGDFLGTAFAWQPWPGRIGAALAVDVSADPETRGKIAGYRLHFFVRLKKGPGERLVLLDHLEGRMAQQARGRIVAIFGDGGTAH